MQIEYAECTEAWTKTFLKIRGGGGGKKMIWSKCNITFDRMLVPFMKSIDRLMIASQEVLTSIKTEYLQEE